jgi:hypothetical protein
MSELQKLCTKVEFHRAQLKSAVKDMYKYLSDMGGDDLTPDTDKTVVRVLRGERLNILSGYMKDIFLAIFASEQKTWTKATDITTTCVGLTKGQRISAFTGLKKLGLIEQRGSRAKTEYRTIPCTWRIEKD